MSLLLPLSLALAAAIIALAIVKLDIEHNGIGGAIGFALGGVLAGLVALGYGAYGWLKFGSWLSITVSQALTWLSTLGFDTTILYAQTGWAGIDKLSASYLSTNLAWTLVFVCYVGFHFGERATAQADAKEREAIRSHPRVGN